MDRMTKLKEFLVTNPQDCFVKHALGLEYIKQGDENSARQLFNEVLQTDENYIGTYYHLAKLLERIGETEEAIAIYEKGMSKAKEKGEQHAYSELRSAYEDLTF
jgi:Tfp pilus assembly protein PilF